MKILVCTIFVLIVLVTGCQTQPETESAEPALKEVFKDKFMIGSALNRDQIAGKDSKSMDLVIKHFNTITPENVLKWEKIHPEPGVYDFEAADAFVEFGQKHNMYIVGHVLVWHNQTPDWVFEDENGNPISREALLKNLKDHIDTVVGRYKGRIHSWEVVNEAITEAGEFRKSKWFEIIGKEYIEKAFQWAHEADPDAELYYNDYNMWYTGRRTTLVELVNEMKSKNVPIHGIGLQAHWGLDYAPLDKLEESIQIYATTGLKLMVTEMEINVLPNPDDFAGANITDSFELKAKFNPYPDVLPDSMQGMLAAQYRNFFKLFLKYKDNISRITFWGVHDGLSWTNNWPVPGRTNYPLLFDRKYEPKPAFYEIIKLTDKE